MFLVLKIKKSLGPWHRNKSGNKTGNKSKNDLVCIFTYFWGRKIKPSSLFFHVPKNVSTFFAFPEMFPVPENVTGFVPSVTEALEMNSYLQFSGLGIGLGLDCNPKLKSDWDWIANPIFGPDCGLDCNPKIPDWAQPCDTCACSCVLCSVLFLPKRGGCGNR